MTGLTGRPERMTVQQLVDGRLGLGHALLLALEHEHVAAQSEPAVQPPLEDLEIGVVLAGQSQCLGVALQVQSRMHAFRHPQPPSLALTRAFTAPPSARPATLAMTMPMTLPISFGEPAPV